MGPGGWRTGQFPEPFQDWNDHFRDTTRSFWLHDASEISKGRLGSDLRDLATRLSGSADLFSHGEFPGGRGPLGSVNFVAAHDGFTLRDLVVYDHKHNLANKEDNRDGNSNNRSWNHGFEGDVVEGINGGPIEVLRRRSMRNLLATVLLSAGTPMLVAGDEMGRTQQGNNNCYCQDNELGWIDWRLDDEGRSLLAFTQRLLALRQRYPILRRGRFLVGEYNEALGVKDVTWLAPGGEEMTEEHWHDEHARCLGVLLDGRAQPTGILRSGEDATLLLILNAYHDAVSFRLPEVAEGSGWTCLLDTQRPEDPLGERYPFASEFLVGGRSFLLFELQPPGAGAEG